MVHAPRILDPGNGSMRSLAVLPATDGHERPVTRQPSLYRGLGTCELAQIALNANLGTRLLRGGGMVRFVSECMRMLSAFQSLVYTGYTLLHC